MGYNWRSMRNHEIEAKAFGKRLGVAQPVPNVRGCPARIARVPVLGMGGRAGTSTRSLRRAGDRLRSPGLPHG